MIGSRIERALLEAVDEIFGASPPSAKGLLRGALIAVCYFGFIIACFDPEPTSSLSFGANVLVWTTYFALGSVILFGTTILMTILGLKPLPAVVSAIVVAPVLIAPFSLFIEYLADIDSRAAFENREILMLYGREVVEVAPVSTAIGAMLALLAYRTGELAKAYRFQVLDRIRPEPGLRELLPELPDRIGGDLIRVEAQDHYVNVVCTGGSALLKLKFSEVVELLKPLRGQQCHRSHWVRLRHVSKITQLGSAHTCKMSNGDIVPVSRRRYSELKRQK